MNSTINIACRRPEVGEALKLCLHYSNYENVNVFTSTDELLAAIKDNEISLVESSLITPFLNSDKVDLKFSLLVTTDNDPVITDALYAGAISFINISKGPAQFVSQVDLVVENKVDEPSHVIKSFLMNKVAIQRNEAAVDYNLTKKEIEILKSMRDAKHLKLIAHETNTSYETVRTHVKRIYKKLGVMSASEAVIKAMKMDI